MVKSYAVFVYNASPGNMQSYLVVGEQASEAVRRVLDLRDTAGLGNQVHTIEVVYLRDETLGQTQPPLL